MYTVIAFEDVCFKIVVDVKLPSNKNTTSRASNYVSLSRATNLQGLVILRPWTSADLRFSLPNGLENEILRLQTASKNCVARICDSSFSDFLRS
jgi:hypothetical protein